mgnify:CR=1 FL=1
MITGQFRHSCALHDTSNILDLLSLLRQLGIALELLAEVARIGTAEPCLKRLADLPHFLERGRALRCRTNLIDPAIALRDRQFVHLGVDLHFNLGLWHSARESYTPIETQGKRVSIEM